MQSINKVVWAHFFLEIFLSGAARLSFDIAHCNDVDENYEG